SDPHPDSYLARYHHRREGLRFVEEPRVGVYGSLAAALLLKVVLALPDPTAPSAPRPRLARDVRDGADRHAAHTHRRRQPPARGGPGRRARWRPSPRLACRSRR